MRKKAIKSKPLPSKNIEKQIGSGIGKNKKYAANIMILYQHVHPKNYPHLFALLEINI